MHFLPERCALPGKLHRHVTSLSETENRHEHGGKNVLDKVGLQTQLMMSIRGHSKTVVIPCILNQALVDPRDHT